MSIRRTCEMWCDNCGKLLTGQNYQQWAASHENAYRYIESCGERCSRALHDWLKDDPHRRTPYWLGVAQ